MLAQGRHCVHIPLCIERRLTADKIGRLNADRCLQTKR